MFVTWLFRRKMIISNYLSLIKLYLFTVHVKILSIHLNPNNNDLVVPLPADGSVPKLSDVQWWVHSTDDLKNAGKTKWIQRLTKTKHHSLRLYASHHAAANCGAAQRLVLGEACATQLEGEEVGDRGLTNQRVEERLQRLVRLEDRERSAVVGKADWRTKTSASYSASFS